jgi:hypothetical protein
MAKCHSSPLEIAIVQPRISITTLEDIYGVQYAPSPRTHGTEGFDGNPIHRYEVGESATD